MATRRAAGREQPKNKSGLQAGVAVVYALAEDGAGGWPMFIDARFSGPRSRSKLRGRPRSLRGFYKGQAR
jgi:hypothetical protein